MSTHLLQQCLSVWSESALRRADGLTVARVWDMFCDEGCFIGSEDVYTPAAMTDPDHTPFQRVLYKPPTRGDPTAFLAVRTLSGTTFEARCSDDTGILGDVAGNLRNKSDGLVVMDLPACLVEPSDDARRHYSLEWITEMTETELRRHYKNLVIWV